ncbi:hypothetical protein ALQ89_200111 [Pseudomonas amygdali pv. tabaci]|uniref:Uncharacterized protein n=1 Tax=Pseudomonas amygdali pv. tabaci TaxID=322 RepID=A0AAX1VZ17_PSEAJ|nr:hypothetical protein ALO60_200138 [Pseudomonas amygdali pv. tabaci]RML83524.1 hypothetical protein ALQ89_200111 [Pseudomonas amygdali pv. tabaci]RMR85678.1 hypothetical protein ALP77_200000 [Pseudomonas amygdali pv. tabaci]
MGTHLRLIVSIILTGILLDHVIVRHLVWIGYMEHILTSTMVDPASRIQHLINELFITYDPHRIATFGVGSGWGRNDTLSFSPLGQRYSPVRHTCAQPSGEVCAKSSGGTSSSSFCRSGFCRNFRLPT